MNAMSMTPLQNDDAPESVRAPMGVAFSDLGRRLVLCRLPCTGATARRLPGQAPGDAPSWQPLAADSCGRTGPLQGLLEHADIWHLRTLLTHEEGFVHRLDDHRVRAAVAHLVERGVLGLFERVEARGRAVAASAAPPAAARSQARPAGPPPSSAAAPSGGRPSPAPAPARPAEAMEAFDQEAQAAVLVVASRVGTPFCEECVRRTREPVEAAAA